MKKIFKRVSAAVIALAVMVTAVVFDVPEMIARAEVISGDGFTYDTDTEKLTVTSNTGTTAWRESGIDTSDVSSVEITNNVTAIGKEAFKSCDIEEITIPDSVLSIGESAFNHCFSLVTVSLSNNLEEIGYYAFGSCSQIISIDIPVSVTAIGKWAFIGCSGLSSVTVPKKVTLIGDRAFDTMGDLAYALYPDCAEGGESAFDDTAPRLKYDASADGDKFKVIEIALGESVTEFTVTDDMNIDFVAEDQRSKVAQSGHSHIYGGAKVENNTVISNCVICDLEKSEPLAAHNHKVCGDENCTDSSHTDISWTGVIDLSNLTSGNYYLVGDVQLDDQITIAAGADITLCLNGHTVTAAIEKRIFNVDGGSLTLCDCKGTGKLTGGNITGNGGGVYVTSGTFTMYDGTISGNDAPYGGGVYAKDGTFTMYGGTISDNTANSGGGVYVSGTGNSNDQIGTFTMHGGTISGNTANNTGGGVYVGGAGTFTMNGGAISDNNAIKNSSGGVYAYGTFTMNDGTISGNTAATNGGGVNVSGTFTMSGGTISENIASRYGGGVYNYGTVTLNGKVDITGNKKSDDSANNVYLYTNKTLAIGDDFSSGSTIGVTTAKAPTNCSTGTVAVAGTVSSDISGSFTVDISGQRVVYKDGVVQLALHTYSDDWSSDGTKHWHECTSCGDITDEAEHTFVAKSDETNHWQECSVCGYKKDVTEHSWGDWTLTTEPTLTTTGAAERECSYGETQTKTDVPALTDTTVWSKDEEQHVEPTEEAEGKDVYTSEYGKIAITLDKLPHSLTHIDETPATETEEGEKEHWHCEGCGKNFSDENGTTEMTDTELTIPAIGHTHTLTHVPEVPATETTAGTKEHWHCSGCDKDFADEDGTTEMTDTELTIPVIGHTHTLTHVPEVPATETTIGTKEHWHCSGCGKDFADENGTTEITDLTIPVIGHTHTLTHVPEVPATDTTTGVKEHWHCSGCGKDFADEDGTTEITDLTIPVIGHTHALTHVPEVPATDTTVGTKEHWHCSGCGKDFADEDGTTEMTDTDLTIPVIGHTHTLTHIPEVPATDTTVGTKEHWHCSGCGKDFADEDGTQEVTADDLKIGKVEVQAPVNVEITTPKEELIAAALTEDEQQEIVKGTDIKIILKVENATENVSAEDKGMVETAIGSLNGHKLGQYLEVTLLKKIGEEQEQKITETNAPIKITFEISPALRGKAEYSVIRVHNGTATVLPDLDSAPNTVTIETDKFSTYALTYKEKTTTSDPGDDPSGGNSSDSSNPSTSMPNESDNSDVTSSGDNTSDSSSDATSSEDSSGSFDTTSSGNGTSTDEIDTNSSGGTSSSDESNHAPSESNPSEENGNPSTGIAVSLVPLTAALAAMVIIAKRRRK